MSHKSILSAVKAMTKTPLISVGLEQHIDALVLESDRAAIILESASIEAILVYKLENAMIGLNADEKDRLFNYQGPAGTFSARILLAQGFGIVDRGQRKKLEIIKEMRNAAAHSHLPITFSDAAIADATLSLLPEQFVSESRDIIVANLRLAFSMAVLDIGMKIADASSESNFDDTTLLEMVERNKMLKIAALLRKT